MTNHNAARLLAPATQVHAKLARYASLPPKGGNSQFQARTESEQIAILAQAVEDLTVIVGDLARYNAERDGVALR